MTATCVLPTDNGKPFNITLDPGYCFAMSLDVAKLMLTNARPNYIPVASQLSPGKWALVQSAYEINRANNDRTIIEAQGMQIVGAIAPTPFHGVVGAVAAAVTALPGTVVFGISSAVGAHALAWFRDDASGRWLCLDPNTGLWKFATLTEGASWLAASLAGYPDLNVSYDAFVLGLA
jgi:hypothetical protein